MSALKIDPKKSFTVEKGRVTDSTDEDYFVFINQGDLHTFYHVSHIREMKKRDPLIKAIREKYPEFLI